MKTISLHIPTVLRFRRWSRAGYAAFRSLACSVTIGVLAFSISDKAMLKAEISCVTHNSATYITATYEEDSAVLQSQIAEAFELNLHIEKSSDASAAAFLQYLNIHPNG